MDEVIIRAQELNKTFSLKRGKRVEALKDLDLTVKKGELQPLLVLMEPGKPPLCGL